MEEKKKEIKVNNKTKNVRRMRLQAKTKQLKNLKKKKKKKKNSEKKQVGKTGFQLAFKIETIKKIEK